MKRFKEKQSNFNVVSNRGVIRKTGGGVGGEGGLLYIDKKIEIYDILP